MDQPVIIVTGASYGIGAAISASAAAKGARVVMAARTKSALEMEAKQIERRGGSVLVVDGDITHHAVCKKIVTLAVKTFGQIDAVINNAGIIGPLGIAAEVRPKDWARTMAVNLLGPVMLCREAIPYLRQVNGRVVNISSGAATGDIPGGSAYCVSKSALNHFSKILSIEEPAVTVLAYNPGNVDTAMQAEIRQKGKVRSFEDLHRYLSDLYQQGQLLSPEKAAAAAITLACHAPHEWSGEFISWDEERVQNLVEEFPVG